MKRDNVLACVAVFALCLAVLVSSLTCAVGWAAKPANHEQPAIQSPPADFKTAVPEAKSETINYTNLASFGRDC